jgi:hypothetical protein
MNQDKIAEELQAIGWKFYMESGLCFEPHVDKMLRELEAGLKSVFSMYEAVKQVDYVKVFIDQDDDELVLVQVHYTDYNCVSSKTVFELTD